MDRLSLLHDLMLLATKYSQTSPWRPAITDLWVYDTIIGMHENDAEDDYWIWNTTPDEVMSHLIDAGKVFDLEYGYEQADEEIREYLIDNDFIVDADSIDEDKQGE